MIAAIARKNAVVFHPHRKVQTLNKIGLLGQGEVMHQKIWPALQSFGPELEQIAVCSIEPESSLNGLPHAYYQVSAGNQLPLDVLREQGFLKDTLWLIATPSNHHLPYAQQLARFCRVAVEKPLAEHSAKARLLRPYAESGFDLYGIDHKLFTASASSFVDQCRQNPSVLNGVSHIEAVFYEQNGFSQKRQAEDVIADIQYHLFVCVVAAFKAVGPFEFVVENAQTAKHQPDPQGHSQTPRIPTASRVRGRLVSNRREITYDFCQAKGAPRNEKYIRFLDAAGSRIAEMDLNESGWQAHARIITALRQPAVDLRHTLSDAISVMELVDASREIAIEESTYEFGSFPQFVAA